MSKKHRRKTKATTALAVAQPSAEYKRAEQAMRSFYSNAVAWGTNLLTDARDEYSLDDVTCARLYGISVTAWACTNFRATIESGIQPLVVTRANEKPVQSDDNPVIWFTDNALRLMYHLSLSVMIWGKFYLRKIYNTRGLPTRLEYLNPLDVSPIVDYTNQTFQGFHVRGRDAIVKPEDMIVSLTFDPLNDFDGVSAFEVAMRQIVGDRELVRFAQKYFQDGTMLGGMLSYEGDLNDAEYRTVKAEFEQFKGSQNAFKTFIAGGGLAKFAYTPMQPSPVDLAMSELKDLLRSDTCAAFGVNPVLIGIGNADDPLSAQSTYEQIQQTFILDQAIPRVRWILEALTKQWLMPDFPEWGDLRLIPDVSEINAASKSVPERSQTAVNNATRIWTLNESRDYTGRPPLPFETVPINPDWAIAAYNAGALTHGEFRRALNFEPDPALVKAYIWQADPRASGQQSQLSFNVQQPPHLPEPPRPKALPAVTRETLPCYVTLSLAGNPALLDIQNQLKRQYPAVEWTQPKDFHLTLVYAPQAVDLDLIMRVLPQRINPFILHLAEVSTFDPQDGKQPVILKVMPEQSLVALQSGLAASFQALGMELSPYSDPTRWQPHITLGYIQADQRLPKWDQATTVIADMLICSVERNGLFQNLYTTRATPDLIPVEIIPQSPMRADPILTKAQLFELDNWQKKVKHKGADTPFEPRHLSDTLAAYVRAELAGYWNPRAVFDEAKRAVKLGGEAHPMGATPEEAQEFWRDFDGLKHDVSRDWLTYMHAVSAVAFDSLIEQRAIDLEKVMADQHSALLDAWVGTLDQPGELAKVMIAGMQAGDRSLQQAVAANPNKPRDVGFNLLWNLASSQAIDFIRSYALNLIRMIDDTTRSDIRAALDSYIANGEDIETLRANIAKTLIPPGSEMTPAIQNRAATIAQTESMRAYNAGAVNRWQNGGTQEATFQTVRDAHVCPLCRPLFRTRANINDGWPDKNGVHKVPPMHVNCRCFMRPVVE